MQDPTSAARPWRLASASSLGSAHHVSGSPCQDAHGWDLLAAGQVLVLVACDGAGSAAHADIGAQLAVRTMLTHVGACLQQHQNLEAIDRDVARGWLDAVVAALAQRAASDGAALRQYACTLLTVIASPRWVCFVQVGDGAIVVRTKGSQDWQCLFWPQHGEYANSTLFVTHPKAQQHFGFGVQQIEPADIAVFTDGIEMLALDLRTKTAHAPFFEWVFTPLHQFAHAGHSRELSLQLESSLASPLFCARTDDDKTLLLASRTQPVPPAQPSAQSEGVKSDMGNPVHPPEKPAKHTEHVIEKLSTTPATTKFDDAFGLVCKLKLKQRSYRLALCALLIALLAGAAWWYWKTWVTDTEQPPSSLFETAQIP